MPRRWAISAVHSGLAICLLIPPPARAADLSHAQALTWDDGQGHTLPYRLFTPDNLPADDDIPIVLFLHGSGERGTDNSAQVSSHIDGLIAATQSIQYQSYLLAPQAPTDDRWDNFGGDATTSLELTFEILDHLIDTLAIDPERVYITGLSMGGFGTFDALSRRPDLFAAAAPMSGGAPRDIAPIIKDVPLWAFHGLNDTVVSVLQTRRIIRALEAAGATPIYSEFAGGHVVWDPLYRDLETSATGGEFYDWMFSQTLPEPSALLMLLILSPLLRRRA